jgi:hypothetical protein
MLIVFESTRVITTATDKWRDRPDADWTMANFQAHFTKANKELVRKLTAQTAGYHESTTRQHATDRHST